MYTINATTRRLRAAVLGAALAATAFPAFGQATTQPVPRGGIREVTPATADGAATERSATTRDGDAATAQRVIPLYAGESRLVKAPWPVKRLSVNNPAIADVDVVSPDQVQLIALSPGVTDLIMWNATDQVWRARVDVEADVSKLRQQLERLFPGAQLQVAQVGEVIAVSGQFARAEQAAHLRTYLEQSGVKHIDMTRVAGSQQVQLQVRVAEVSRTALRTLSSDFAITDGLRGVAVNNAASGTYNPGTIPPAPGDSVFNRSLPGGTTIFGTGTAGDYLFEYFLQALAENQYLRVLSEPTLVAYSGEEATFLVGGEVPIPTSEFGEGSTSVSIEYREYGVRLRFRPTVTGESGIRLVLEPEVSELTDVGAIEIQGIRIPALLTRRISTTLELDSGQTFAMAGLLNQSINARSSRIPWLGDLPVLGTLFRSTRYASSETELVVLVTASLVEPQNTPIDALPVPGAAHNPPGAWEFYALGHIKGRPSKLSPAHRERLTELGLNDLRGPGAWASHDSNQGQTKAEAPRKN
jgi:pilus assembly protein CpaC